jgi:DNA-binding beta-propeller fold protein YncE
VVAAYKINGSQIEAQTTASGLPNRGEGAVGLALDPESETLFVTHEKGSVAIDKIDLIDAKIMQVEQGPATAPGAENLAGVVFDESKQKLYAVDRGSNKLFVYQWDPMTKSLALEGGTYKSLLYGGAMGIALDGANGYILVTNATNIVRYYDTNDPDFAYKGSIEIAVSGNSREAVGIAIDSTRRYMYTGSFTGSSGQHYCVVRTDINDINSPTFTENDIRYSRDRADG